MASAAHHQVEDTNLGQALLCVVFTDCSKLQSADFRNAAPLTPKQLAVKVLLFLVFFPFFLRLLLSLAS